jgi:hypothetical protein
MGVNDPVPFDQAECDGKIARVVKEAAERNTKTCAERDEKSGVNSPRSIYNRLRKEKYALEQAAKSAEVFTNNIADNCREWMKRIEALLKRRKQAASDNLLGEERSIEKQIQQLENDLLNEQDKYSKAGRANTFAARALREWVTANDAQLVELQKEFN